MVSDRPIPISKGDLRESLRADDVAYVKVPIIQPVEPFFESSSETIRKQIVAIAGGNTAPYCLRPEFTIPISLHYLDQSRDRPAKFSYSGPIFRLEDNGPAQYWQAGIESFADPDEPLADATIASKAIGLLKAAGDDHGTIKVADMELLDAIIALFGVEPSKRRRLIRAVNGQAGAAASGGDSRAGEFGTIITMIRGRSEADVLDLIDNIFAISGLKEFQGRSRKEIARRLMKKAQSASELENHTTEDVEAALAAYGALDVAIDEVVPRIRTIVGDRTSERLESALSNFSARLTHMKAMSIDTQRMRYDGAFTRDFSYYTGFIFECGHLEDDGWEVGGGRYDSLLTALGGSPTKAVGCAVTARII